ncbi:hypothetical protein LQZ18_15535 [Lachnospiraceae bacterium ZAX-1]
MCKGYEADYSVEMRYEGFDFECEGCFKRNCCNGNVPDERECFAEQIKEK